MLCHVIMGSALTSISPFGAKAHTTDAPHPHPHSMDLFANNGVVTLALMLVAFALLHAARQLLQLKSRAISKRRGQR